MSKIVQLVAMPEAKENVRILLALADDGRIFAQPFKAPYAWFELEGPLDEENAGDERKPDLHKILVETLRVKIPGESDDK